MSQAAEKNDKCHCSHDDHDSHRGFTIMLNTSNLWRWSCKTRDFGWLALTYQPWNMIPWEWLASLTFKASGKHWSCSVNTDWYTSYTESNDTKITRTAINNRIRKHHHCLRICLEWRRSVHMLIFLKEMIMCHNFPLIRPQTNIYNWKGKKRGVEADVCNVRLTGGQTNMQWGLVEGRGAGVSFL